MTKKRKRYRDVVHIKPLNGSRIKDFDWRTRHDKRKTEAIRECRNAGLAFASLGAWLSITNEWHHWQIRFPKGEPLIVEWWPATAKVVVNKTWNQGLHIHRWQDLFQVVRGLRAKMRTER